MSSDSQPSLRAYWKSKIKNVIKPNITSSIRGQLIPNDTYHSLREKYQNFTDVVKDRTGLEKIINKTKTLIPGVRSSDDNQTFSKGFYDSLFSPDTAEDVYFEVIIICLWVIAILCIIPTIITMFISVEKYGTKTGGVRTIFFHIFLCELFYLIYILLSMINVAQNFQMTSLFCNFANYGMYITIPVMHFALFFLTLERLSKRFSATTACTRIFSKTYVIQVILFFIWIIFIAILTTIMLIKGQVWKTIENNVKNIAPPMARDFLDKFVSTSYRCSIDGRLSSVFKVLFIVLFIILIVLIIKSMAISIFYSFLTLNFCKPGNKVKKSNDRYMTLLCLIFLFLNVLLSFPFYFASMATTVTQLITRNDTYSTSLKICFALRISSIILQCFTFFTFENNSWTLLRRLLYHGTCKKCPILIDNGIPIKKPTNTNKSRDIYDSSSSLDSYVPRRTYDKDASKSDENSSKDSDSENEDDDEVFIEESKTEPVKTKKSATTTVDVTKTKIDSDDETKHQQKLKLLTRKSNEKRDQTEEEKISIKNLTSEYNKTNGISQKTPNNELISQQISSTTTKPKTSKPNTNYSMIETSSSDDDDDDNDRISHVSLCSDYEMKPFKNISKTKPITHISSNEQKRNTDILTNNHHSANQQHRKKSHLQSSTSTNHHHVKTQRRRKRSSMNKNSHIEKPKRNRRSNILEKSDDV
ncbi:unnamed protein product [Rotaria sp. Silwood2]|nr:unnamed protein product [Rotaria sp. Silwood2]CAF2599676.1 unnamed protein product [Rotaria sp. Silwood2]CAF4024373.1 unnamed protein product [Rotaria sp. Silwood2]CAF4082024.1 unnamed protein product [Rotaria sp. Silwood2]